jgi:hypothetical protein
MSRKITSHDSNVADNFSELVLLGAELRRSNQSYQKSEAQQEAETYSHGYTRQEFHRESKKACSRSSGTSPLKQGSFRLEADLQAHLHVPSVESSGRLAKICGRVKGSANWIRVEVSVVRATASRGQNEIRMVENVEGSRIELHTDPFSNFERLG